MAKFLCHATEPTLWETLASSCQEHGATLQHEGETASAIIRFPEFLRSAWKFAITTRPGTSAHQTELTITPALAPLVAWIQRIPLLLAVAIGTHGMGLVLRDSHDPDTFLTAFFLVVLAFFLSIIHLILLAIPRRHARQHLIRLRENISSRFRMKQVEPLELKGPRTDLYIILPSVIIILLFQCAIVFGLIFGIVLAIPVTTVVLTLVVVKSRLHGWHAALHNIHGMWPVTLFLGTLPILIMLTMGVMTHCRAYQREGLDQTSTRIVSDAIATSFIDTRNLAGAPRAFAEDMLETAKQKLHEEAAYIVVMSVTLCGILAYGFRQTSDNLKYWKILHLKDDPALHLIGPASTESPITKADKALIACNGLLLALTYWALALVALEGASYALLGTTLFLKPIGWSLELFRLRLEFLGLPNWAAGTILAILVLLSAAAGLTVLWVSFIRMARLALACLPPRKNQQTSTLSEYREWLRYTSEQIGIPVPRLQITSGKNQRIYSQGALLPMMPGKIFISEKTISALDEPEIEALLAHEIYHLKHNAWHVEALKFLSSLCLFPMYYFLILYDFPRHERDADEFALNVIGNSEALKSALVQLQIAGNIHSDQEPEFSLRHRLLIWSKKLRNRSRFLRAISLYFDDSIFAAAYPTLTERLQYIDEMSITTESPTA